MWASGLAASLKGNFTTTVWVTETPTHRVFVIMLLTVTPVFWYQFLCMTLTHWCGYSATTFGASFRGVTDHWHLPGRLHHANIARHTALAVCVSVHHFHNFADDTTLSVADRQRMYVCWSPLSRLHAADCEDIIIPSTWTARYCPRSFLVVGSEIWNTLPSHLKDKNISWEQFKSDLKTWLFMQAYSWEAPLRTVFEQGLTNVRFDIFINCIAAVAWPSLCGY